MSAGENNRQPRVPEGEPPELYVTPISGEEITNFPMDALRTPNEPDFNMLAGSPLNIAGLVGGYAIEGTNAQQSLASYIRAQAGEKEGGKISKKDVAYVPFPPFPPGLWDYRCRTCRFYRGEGEGTQDGARCSVVGQEGDPFGGAKIHAQGWCTLWLPPDDREALEGLREAAGFDWDND